METKHLNRIYDLLVSIGGADETKRSSFIYHHCEDKQGGCREWRFKGKLGKGGKYRSAWNKVTYYPEDETPELLAIKKKLNQELKKI